MGKGKKISQVDGTSASRKLGIDDKLVVIALRMMAIEINGLRPLKKKQVAEWYYSLFKSPDFSNTTFHVKKGRDPNASRHADSFRKSFIKQLSDRSFTVEFLTKVVLGFRIFGPFATWQEFVLYVDSSYDDYVKAHEPAYNTIIAHADVVGVRIPEDIFFPWYYAEYAYGVAILLNSVAFTIGDSEPKYLAAESYHRRVFFAQASQDLNNLEIYDHSIANSPRAIEFNKELLFKTNRWLFYFTVGRIPALMLDSISIIPLNNFGHWQLKYGRLFYKEIMPEMLWPPMSDHSGIGCIYLDCCTGIVGLGVMSEFSHYIDILIARLVSVERMFDVPIYISDDSSQKLEIINRYGFDKTEIEVEANLLIRYNENEVERFFYGKSKVSLYQIKLYKLLWMKYTVGETDFSFD